METNPFYINANINANDTVTIEYNKEETTQYSNHTTIRPQSPTQQQSKINERLKRRNRRG